MLNEVAHRKKSSRSCCQMEFRNGLGDVSRGENAIAYRDLVAGPEEMTVIVTSISQWLLHGKNNQI